MARPWPPARATASQPLEFMDEAYYSVLGADVARTGTESLYSPSGFTDIPGLPSQTWYHWGEAWLTRSRFRSSAPSHSTPGTSSPCPLLLAAAALTGTLVRRMTGSPSRGSSCSASSPVCSWPGPSLAGISARGRSGSCSASPCTAQPRWPSCSPSMPRRAGQPGDWALAASSARRRRRGLLPAHIVIAVLVLVGVGSVWAVRIGQSLLTTRRLPVVPPVWQRACSPPGLFSWSPSVGAS